MRCVLLSLIIAGCAAPTAQDSRNEAAASFENQYKMLTATNASAPELCARAKLVAEGHLQAGNQAKYEEWQRTAKVDCTLAAIPPS